MYVIISFKINWKCKILSFIFYFRFRDWCWSTQFKSWLFLCSCWLADASKTSRSYQKRSRHWYEWRFSWSSNSISSKVSSIECGPQSTFFLTFYLMQIEKFICALRWKRCLSDEKYVAIWSYKISCKLMQQQSKQRCYRVCYGRENFCWWRMR